LTLQRYVNINLATNTFLFGFHKGFQAGWAKASIPCLLNDFHGCGWYFNFKAPAFCRSTAYK